MIPFRDLSNALRFLSVDAVEKAKSGHPGMPLGMADVVTILFKDHLHFNPQDHNWPNRDRLILSAGHGSMILYSALHLAGYPQISLDQIKSFRQLNSHTPGHPEYGHTHGVETTTGPLGQGLATSVGIALGERILQARVGKDLVNHYTYVIASDGDLMEGISQEAISLAGHLRLNKLIVLFDDNGISIDGPTSLSTSENHIQRFEAVGWNTRSIDGHNPEEIHQALVWAKESDKPVLIACKTLIGLGCPTKEGKSSSHGSPLGGDELQGLRANLNWPHSPFEIPPMIRDAWASFSLKSVDPYNEWQRRFEASSPLTQVAFNSPTMGTFTDALNALKNSWLSTPQNKATRQLSQEAIESFIDNEPKIIGGSADLTGSNNTKGKEQKVINADNFHGQYIHYGIREHAMAACMNGLSLYGFIPYGGTFLTFSDYLKPALRLSALMDQGVIHVLTHDSIGLGEDGPTHQPIEHLAALRAIPNVSVYRPCDGIEVIESWQCALEDRHNPSVIVLSRQALPQVSLDFGENITAKGAYVIRSSSGNTQAQIIATGSEVHLAIEAFETLKSQGIAVEVISMPCMERFLKQPKDYQQTILKDLPRVVVEAACDFGWHRFMRQGDSFIGMQGFGASAPAEDLYAHFGITTNAIIHAVKERI